MHINIVKFIRIETFRIKWQWCLIARLTFRSGTETCLGLSYHYFFIRHMFQKTNRINKIDNQVKCIVVTEGFYHIKMKINTIVTVSAVAVVRTYENQIISDCYNIVKIINKQTKQTKQNMKTLFFVKNEVLFSWIKTLVFEYMKLLLLNLVSFYSHLFPILNNTGILPR